LSGYLRNLNISGGGHISVGTGNSFAHFWSVTSWLVSNSRLVATLVDVDTLVVTEVFTATPLESHAESPFGGVTRLSETCNVSVWIGLCSLGSVAGHLVLGVDELVDVAHLTGIVALLDGGGPGDHRVLLQEAPEQVLFVSETFNKPLDHINVEAGIEAATRGLTLSLSDQVVDVAGWVSAGVQETELALGGEALLSWDIVVLFVGPS
jgi:hypothetical protein